MESLFQFANLAVLPFWALLIFLPRWTWTRRIVAQPYFLLPWAVLYVILVVPGLLDVLPTLLQPTLESVSALLGKPEAALIGWIHFLVFDLFVGRWIYLESRERNLSVWLISPILFLTLMLGPAGLLAYLTVRPFGRAAIPPG